jgi:hypothetical protein
MAWTTRAATLGGGWLVGGLFQQDRELVAAETGHGVLGPVTVSQRLGHRDQELVTGGVAEPVVDVIEVVQVDEQQRHGGGLAEAAGQGMLDPVGEQSAVGQPGQAVVEGLVFEIADHGGELALELLLVEHGEQLAAEHQHHQDREAPVQERAGGPMAQLHGGRGDHRQRQGQVGQQRTERVDLLGMGDTGP